MTHDKDEGDGSKSMFNAGVAQTVRLDRLQQAMNAARFNLKAINMETGTYNYECFLNAASNAVDEVWPKLDADEKKNIKKLIDTSIQLIRLHPPYESYYSKGETKQTFNAKNYYELETLIMIISRRVREILDAHDFNSPSKDADADGWQ